MYLELSLFFVWFFLFVFGNVVDFEIFWLLDERIWGVEGVMLLLFSWFYVVFFGVWWCFIYILDWRILFGVFFMGYEFYCECFVFWWKKKKSVYFFLRFVDNFMSFIDMECWWSVSFLVEILEGWCFCFWKYFLIFVVLCYGVLVGGFGDEWGELCLF